MTPCCRRCGKPVPPEIVEGTANAVFYCEACYNAAIAWLKALAATPETVQ